MRYEVTVKTIMSASVWIDAENEDKAVEIVENAVNPIDYANETCGFDILEIYDENGCISEITNTQTDYMEIDGVYEAE